MSCPRGPDCRCEEHHPGLSVYARDPDAFEAALARCRPQQTRLSIVTLGPSPEPQPCTNTMTCTCPECRQATAFLLKRGAQGEGNASPFKTRRAA